MKKDLISKDIIKEIIKDIGKYFLNLDINNITFLDKELSRIEKREADIVANIDNQYILHLEIQNANDKFMANRMLRYYSDIERVTDLPIKQYLIYIGKSKANFKTKMEKDLINYSYNFIDIKNIDCDVLLNQNTPEALVLAILCDFKDKNPKDVIKFIITKLREYSKYNSNEYRKYIMMLETLSTNRDLLDIVKEIEMLREITYQDLPSYQIGMQQGIQEGMQQGMQQGIQQGIEKEREKAISILYSMGIDIDTISNKFDIDKERVLYYLDIKEKK